MLWLVRNKEWSRDAERAREDVHECTSRLDCDRAMYICVHTEPRRWAKRLRRQGAEHCEKFARSRRLERLSTLDLGTFFSFLACLLYLEVKWGKLVHFSFLSPFIYWWHSFSRSFAVFSWFLGSDGGGGGFMAVFFLFLRLTKRRSRSRTDFCSRWLCSLIITALHAVFAASSFTTSIKNKRILGEFKTNLLLSLSVSRFLSCYRLYHCCLRWVQFHFLIMISNF